MNQSGVQWGRANCISGIRTHTLPTYSIRGIRGKDNTHKHAFQNYEFPPPRKKPGQKKDQNPGNKSRPDIAFLALCFRRGINAPMSRDRCSLCTFPCRQLGSQSGCNHPKRIAHRKCPLSQNRRHVHSFSVDAVDEGSYKHLCIGNSGKCDDYLQYDHVMIPMIPIPRQYCGLLQYISSP